MPTATGRYTRTGASSATGRYTRTGSGSGAPADVTATVAASSFRTSVTRTSVVQTDNWLGYFSPADALDEIALAKTNLATVGIQDYALFAESFGNGRTIPDSWNGITAMPAPDLASANTVLTNTAAIRHAYTRLHVYLHRLPWQFTGVPSTGVASTAANYNDEGRRLKTDQSANYVQWVRQVSAWFMTNWNVRIFKVGSEMKGFQSSNAVSGVRDSVAHTWDYDFYAGTAGQANMGFGNYYDLFTQGIALGAADAGVAIGDITLGCPYPVVDYKGATHAGGVNFSSRVNSLAESADYSMVNGTLTGVGYPSKAAMQAIDEILIGCQSRSLKLDWLSTDFGMWSSDGVVPNANDFTVTRERVKGQMQWMQARLAARGWSSKKIDLAEFYLKAQNHVPIDAMPEALRYTYYAALKAVGLYAALTYGAHTPCFWSPFGEADNPTTVAGVGGPYDKYGGWVTAPVKLVTGTRTVVAEGGTARASLAVMKSIRDNFAEGVALHAVTFSEPDVFDGIGSATKAMVTNMTNSAASLSLGGETYPFTAYETRLLNV